jgi:hypothetical protein
MVSSANAQPGRLASASWIWFSVSGSLMLPSNWRSVRILKVYFNTRQCLGQAKRIDFRLAKRQRCPAFRLTKGLTGMTQNISQQ